MSEKLSEGGGSPSLSDHTILTLEAKVATLERQLAERTAELARVLGEASGLAQDCGEMNTAELYEARRRRILGGA